MMFILGFVSGIMFFFLSVVLNHILDNKKINIPASVIDYVDKKTKPKGAIYEAPLDIDIARQEIIEKNKEEGRITKVSELMD